MGWVLCWWGRGSGLGAVLGGRGSGLGAVLGGGGEG